ncbi:hypothetical protein MFIFM68171_11191 [Madurella fahalii]|uniref:Uncharacterized protein n=1 Tax=Madurella fahalii TaxID=1157608 RepID=A0ABQ0GTA8_9PEZI
MKIFHFIALSTWLSQDVYASGDEVVLEPVPRHLWDTSIHRRDDATEPANVTLGDYEQLLWSTGGKTNHSKVVSLVTWTGQGRRIIDMARFAWELKAVSCTEDMMLQFRHNISFQAAKREWEWVNFNTMHSFVMVADHFKCGKDWSPHPWVVSRASYHAHNLTIRLHAEKSTWRKVTRSYVIDFGEINRRLPKRAFDFNGDGVFTLYLASSWPRTFFNRTWDGTKFTVSCAECGTRGSLVFAGHIEGSVFGGIDHLMISATPNNLGASLNLEAKLSGFYDFTGKDWASQEFELTTIPLPSGWRIPGILTFGPNGKLLAGYELTSIAGHATVTAGASASITDDSIAKVDIFSDDKVEIHGWIPTFEVQPPKLTEGGITVKGKDEDGISADVYVQIPLSIEAESAQSLAWRPRRRSTAKKDVFFSHLLYSDPDVVDLPPLCLTFGEAPAGSCLVVPESDDATWDWWQNEVDPESEDDDDDEDDNSTDAIVSDTRTWRWQEEKPKKTRFDYYNMECDPRDGNSDPVKHSKWRIKLKSYPGPSTIEEWGAAGNLVPIMKLGIEGCSDTDATQCLPDKWVVEKSTDENDLNLLESWNSEHVYEGGWIRDYFDHLHDDHFKDCDAVSKAFKAKYADGLLNSIGTSQTYDEMMTLFPLRENKLKYRVFAPDTKVIDSKFGAATDGERNYDATAGACALGRLVMTCRYMEHAETQTRLKTSIRAIDTVLKRLDEDNDANLPPKPSTLTSYQAAHKEWFIAMYGEGIKKMQGQILSAAEYLFDHGDFKTLPQEIQDAVKPLTENNKEEKVKEWCKDNIVYPDA